jgi:hypothetical protein
VPLVAAAAQQREFHLREVRGTLVGFWSPGYLQSILVAGYHLHFLDRSRTAGGHVLEVDVDADGHPGYLTTARMLGEAGLMLAEPGVTPDRAGCLTPATALGTAAIDRFERARMRFSVSD